MIKPNAPPAMAPMQNAQNTTPRPLRAGPSSPPGPIGPVWPKNAPDPGTKAHLHFHVALAHAPDQEHREEEEEAKPVPEERESAKPARGPPSTATPQVVQEAEHPAAQNQRQRDPVRDFQSPSVDHRGQDHAERRSRPAVP